MLRENHNKNSMCVNYTTKYILLVNTLEDWVLFPVEDSLSPGVQRLWSTYSFRFNVTTTFCLERKAIRSEADHSVLFVVQFKQLWICRFTLAHSAWCVSYISKDNSTFVLIDSHTASFS